MSNLRADIEQGLFTPKMLAAIPAAPDAERITAEIMRLDALIDAASPGTPLDQLVAAFRALNWARSPDAFAPPSQE